MVQKGQYMRRKLFKTKEPPSVLISHSHADKFLYGGKHSLPIGRFTPDTDKGTWVVKDVTHHISGKHGSETELILYRARLSIQ